MRVMSVCVKNRSLGDFSRALTRTLTRIGHMDGSQYISYVLHFSLTRARTMDHVQMDGLCNVIFGRLVFFALVVQLNRLGWEGRADCGP